MVLVLLVGFLAYRSVGTGGHSSTTGTPYVVRAGDSLYLIGLEYGVPWQTIAELNGLAPPYKVTVGETVYIPTEDPSCAAAGVDLKDNQTYGAPAYGSTSPQADQSKRVVLRFDDSLQNQWVDALPVLAKYGYHATFSVIVGSLLKIQLCGLDSPEEELSWPEVQWLYQNGNEISDHTLSHANLDSQSANGLQNQVIGSRDLLLAHGVESGTLTLPYGAGAANSTVTRYILNNGFGYIYLVEGTENATSGALGVFPRPTVNFTWTSVDQLDRTQSLSSFESIVSRASSSTVIGVDFHNVSDHVSGTGYYVNDSNFQQMMSYLSENHYDVIMPWQVPGMSLPTGT